LVRAELQQIEEHIKVGRRAIDAGADLVPQAVERFALGALAVLLHLGCIDRTEEAEWRTRFRERLGEGFERRSFRISAVGKPERALTAHDEAVRAYHACQAQSITHLAWVHHTAAARAAIADALAENTIDPDRVRRAAKAGFADHGKDVLDGNFIMRL